METVKQILEKKDQKVWSINPKAKVFKALELMAEKEIGALVVVDNNEVVGMFSERDYARKVILLGKSSKEIPVSEIMSEKVIYVEPEQSVEECMALMTHGKIRHLPVIDGGQLIGMVSIGDIVKALIGEKEFIIDQLIHYITGTASVEQ
jgi:CBS domain-containing protein